MERKHHCQALIYHLIPEGGSVVPSFREETETRGGQVTSLRLYDQWGLGGLWVPACCEFPACLSPSGILGYDLCHMGEVISWALVCLLLSPAWCFLTSEDWSNRVTRRTSLSHSILNWERCICRLPHEAAIFPHSSLPAADAKHLSQRSPNSSQACVDCVWVRLCLLSVWLLCSLRSLILSLIYPTTDVKFQSALLFWKCNMNTLKKPTFTWC